MAQQTIDQTGQERLDYAFAKMNAMFKDLYAGTGSSGQALTPTSVTATGAVQGATVISTGAATFNSATITNALSAASITNTTLLAVGTGTATGGGDARLSTQLSVAGVGNGADTTEDTLFTYSLPANTLANVGQEVDIEAWGSVAASSATKTVRVYFGASVITLAYTTTQTGNWRARLRVVKQAASVQLVLGEADALGATTTRVLANITTGADTDTNAIVIKVTGQSSVATANLILANGIIINASN
jgi:hypothetical protein